MAPFIVITTEHAALPEHNGLVTLTVACAPAIFISEQTEQDGFHAGPPWCNDETIEPLNVNVWLSKTRQHLKQNAPPDELNTRGNLREE